MIGVENGIGAIGLFTSTGAIWCKIVETLLWKAVCAENESLIKLNRDDRFDGYFVDMYKRCV